MMNWRIIMNTITVLKILPGYKPEVTTIPHTLKAMQELVQGQIEAIYPFDDLVAIVCNDEGKLLGMDMNRALHNSENGEIYDIICGPFFICGLSSDDFTSLTNEQIEKYQKLFLYPETFIKTKYGFISVKNII